MISFQKGYQREKMAIKIKVGVVVGGECLCIPVHYCAVANCVYFLCVISLKKLRNQRPPSLRLKP